MITKLTEGQVRAILTAQATTALQLKQARAKLVIRCVREGVKSHEMWARVDLDTADLAERAALADVEAKVLWLLHGHAIGPAVSEGALFE